MKYDAFISYRRQGGAERAELVKKVLEERGFKQNRVFMDTHSLLGGDFKKRIKEAIEQSVNVIVLITEGCFDNIKEEDYWIFELSEATASNKQIIPVFFDGIRSLEKSNLPIVLKELPLQNAVRYEHDYSDAAYEKLISFMAPDKDLQKKNLWKKTLLYSCFVLCAIAIAYILTKYINNNEVENKDTTIELPEGTVDLGLPSGTLWYSCNLDADNPSDYGALYAWGETKGITSKTVNPKRKGISLDNIIGTSYDAATILIGEHWSLPTEEQFKELITQCKWEWTSQDGHLGYIVTGSNQHAIFFPVAGCFTRKGIEYQEQFGYYWTGEKGTQSSDTDARELIIGRGQINIESGKQFIGRSIRPVITSK